MSYRVPSKNYAQQYGELWPELGAEIERVFREENPVLGESVAAFEREFADYLGVQHVVGVGTGTDALVLSLRAIGVGPGDEVITAANTFAATVTAIVMVGAKPVLVDPDPRTLTIDADGVASVIATGGKQPTSISGWPNVAPARRVRRGRRRPRSSQPAPRASPAHVGDRRRRPARAAELDRAVESASSISGAVFFVAWSA